MSTHSNRSGRNEIIGGPEDVSGEKPHSKAEALKQAIERFEKRLAAGEVKPTVAEYIRLLEIEREIDQVEQKEIRAKWVEPDEMESSSRK